jgi:hypothetical protein
MCFGPFWRMHDATTGRNGRLYCNSSWARWIGSSVLVCGYFGMYKKRSWLVSVASVFSFGVEHVSILFAHGCTPLVDMGGFISIPHEHMDCELPPSWRVLRRVYRIGLDWFQKSRSFRLESKMCFCPFWSLGCVAG